MKSFIDMSKAFVVSSEKAAGAEEKAVSVLVEEIAKRTGFNLPRLKTIPEGAQTAIFVGTKEHVHQWLPPELAADVEQLKPEGYLLSVIPKETSTSVFIVGADARGVLFGVGKWLRKLRLQEKSVLMEAGLKVISSPRYPIRGHQLGYRPKTNAYDAWTVEQYEQYIRELALFGANSIEIMPPRTDDDATGPLMKLDPLEMMIRLSAIIDSYGLDVWVWYPNLAEDYSDPKIRQAELAEREEIFSKIPHVHAVFIPGSDPGDMQPEPLFRWAQEVAEVLHRYHPAAKIWLSPQVMKHESRRWLDAFYEQVDRQPDWLGGIVFGPHVDDSLPELRRRIPAKYPIRRYEDITHNYHCQYPVVAWDLSLAMTSGRECYNPRPVAQKHIHNVFAPYAAGNISYSEGINDDVNKFIWCDQDWDPDTPVIETLRDYARLFIGCDVAEAVAQGLLALEENWNGSLIVNEGVEVTLQQWMQMEEEASPKVRNNYRFQMGLLRAYFDAYVKRRLIYETELEYRARDALREAGAIGSLAAIKKVEDILDKARTEPVAQDYKQKCEQLADALFANIGSQPTVKRHFAIATDRGAFMDTIDVPLNNADWLRTQCEIIRALDNEEERLIRIRQALNRTNPGPGGFYDNLGRSMRRVDPGIGWEQDPGFLHSPRVAPSAYVLRMSGEKKRQLGGVPLAWASHVNTISDTPITVTYDNLNPELEYTVKVVYIGDVGSSPTRDTWLRLTVNGRFVLQDNIFVPAGACVSASSPIPGEALRDGKITLTFQRVKGFKRMNIAEIWVIPNQ